MSVGPPRLSSRLISAQTDPPRELAPLAKELVVYAQHSAPRFYRREQSGWPEVYLRGLLTVDVPRKNGGQWP